MSNVRQHRKTAVPPELARTARSVLHTRRLYKYRSLADAVQMERLQDIVLGHRIRFSRPSELNDPLEGKPIYTLGDWTSPEYRTRFSYWACLTQRRVTSPPPEAAFRTWVLAQPAEVHAGLVERVNTENQAEIERKWRVLSLSATATHDLMWSHYSDGHRGVALVFDASLGEFALAYEVSYAAERESQDVTTQDLKATLRLTLLTKRSAWAYEQEFRSIGTEDQEADTLHLPQQFLQFQPPQLVGIIFGAKITKENEATIRAWALQRVAPLGVFRASLDAGGGVEVQDGSTQE